MKTTTLIIMSCIVGCTSGGDATDAGVNDATAPYDATLDAATTDALVDAAPVDGPVDAPTADVVDAADTPNRIFVTSVTYPNADLGGASGADAKCQSLGGATFIAYLSTSTATAASRLGTARGWVRMDGKPVADKATDLSLGNLLYPVSIDENGHAVTTPTSVATAATNTGGFNAGYSCGDWTSLDGGDQLSGGYWTSGCVEFQNYFSTSCTMPVRLYCLETTHNAIVSPPVSTGRYAFVASKAFDTSTQLAGADAICASDATTNSLPGTYLALLATSTASAASRFTLTGAAWSRPDGVAIVDKPSDIANDEFVAPIALTAAGARTGNSGAWSGSTSIGAVGTDTCGDWTLSDAGMGAIGTTGYLANYDLSPVFFSYNTACGQSFPRFFCLQE